MPSPALYDHEATDSLWNLANSSTTTTTVESPQTAIWADGDWAKAAVTFRSPDEEYHVLVKGRGERARDLVYATWLMYQLPKEALNDLFDEISAIGRFYFGVRQQILPEPRQLGPRRAKKPF
ncbi:MAG: hypothetical protein IH869_01730 [Chloroflexi bacterium]|nr:hypothetical protein [Chloroflexota bacterium]